MAGTDTGEDNAAARLVRAVDAVARVRLIGGVLRLSDVRRIISGRSHRYTDRLEARAMPRVGLSLQHAPRI